MPKTSQLEKISSQKGNPEVSFHLHLSHVTTALIVSPILPPELRYVTDRSVDTPVANKPRDATAKEPPKSTTSALETEQSFRVLRILPMLAMVPP